MANENLNANASLGIDISKFVKDINQAVTAIASMKGQSKELDAELDKVERKLVAMGGAAKKLQGSLGDTTGIEKQRHALSGMVKEYNALTQAQGAIKGRGAVNQQNPLLQQRLTEEKKAYDDRIRQEQQFATYRVQSNRRIAAAEIAEVKKTQAAVTAERKNQLGQLQATAQQENRILNQRMAVQAKASEAQVRYAREAQQAGVQYGQEAPQGLSNTRYALYDVATTWTAVATATLGASVAATSYAINFERDFANVERTSGAVGAQLATLRSDLIAISTTKPIDFGQITEVGTLAGQLGVDAEAIAGFTEVVAEFSATTDTSLQGATLDLGRLAQLTGTASTEYRNLASAIYETGINSIATEGQILKTASQIATAGDLAGFANHEIIALASAFASLNVAPERARGSVQRIFGEITESVSTGGDQLQKFADVANLTVEQFTDAWQNDPQKAFTAFIEGMHDIQEANGDTNALLKELGISAVRDIQALQALANNTDVYADALRDSSSAYAEGTALGEGYAIIAETVSAKLQILKQTIQAIIAGLGSGGLGPLEFFVDLLQTVSQALLSLSSTGGGKVIGAVVLGIAALIGVMAAFRAMNALATASIYAMVTANAGLAQSHLKIGTGIKGLITQLGILSVGTERAAAAQKAYNLSLQEGSGRLAAFTAGAKASTGAVNGMAAAGRAAATAFAWTAVLAAGIYAMQAYSQGQAETKARVDELTASLDAQSGAVTQLSRSHVYANLQTENQTAIEAAKRLSLDMADVVTASMDPASEAFKVLKAEFDAVNVALSEAQAKVTGPNFTEADVQKVNSLNSVFNDYQTVLDAVGYRQDEVKMAQEALRDAQEAGVDTANGITFATEDYGDALDGAVDKIRELIDAEYEHVGGVVAVQNSLANLGQSLADNGTDFSAYSVAGRENLGALQSVVSAMAQSSGGDAAVLAANIQGLMQALAAMGADTAGQLMYLQGIVNSLTNGRGVSGSLPQVTLAANDAGNALRQGFSSGAKKAGSSAAKARKEVRTLTDYVSDLSKVFSSSFEFRFGLDQSVDKVADQYRQLSDYSEQAAQDVQDAADAIAEADAKIRGLNVDSQTLRYQLTVAQEYGDTLRAAEILEKLAQNADDVAEAQRDRGKAEKDMGKAQAASNKSLTANTAESAEQRSMVLDLLEAYHSQIEALANTGMSQQQLAAETQRLKAQFEAQLVAMGYSRAEVGKYSKSFDDLTYAINNVPRNITVNANTDPAVRAVNELLAKINSASGTVGVGAAGDGYGAGYEAGRAYGEGWSKGQGLTRRLKVIQDGGVTGGVKYTYDGVNFFLNKGGQVPEYHASGGAAGHPGAPKGPDTVPAWLTPGEYVQRTAAVQHYGLPFMNAINNLQIPKYFSGGGGVGVSASRGPAGPQLVELLPNQLHAIIQGVSSQLIVDGKVLAETVGQQNVRQSNRGAN